MWPDFSLISQRCQTALAQSWTGRGSYTSLQELMSVCTREKLGMHTMPSLLAVTVGKSLCLVITIIIKVVLFSATDMREATAIKW